MTNLRGLGWRWWHVGTSDGTPVLTISAASSDAPVVYARHADDKWRLMSRSKLGSDTRIAYRLLDILIGAPGYRLQESQAADKLMGQERSVATNRVDLGAAVHDLQMLLGRDVHNRSIVELRDGYVILNLPRSRG